MARWTVLLLVSFAFIVTDANEYCYMRGLCPRGEHLGCSFNEHSWRLIPAGPIPLKRSSDINIDEQQQILDLHNTLRRSMAKGLNDTHRPPRTISNMRELQWSEQLAYLARVRVTLFNMRSGSDCANLPKYQVGMNQYTQSYPVAPSDSTPWEVVAKYWYSFSRFVAYGIVADMKAYRDLAQFSQMLWPTTYEIGCASNGFIMPGGYMRNVVCFYGPVARCDDDTNPFQLGEPASSCTEGTVPKDGLCGFAEPVVSNTTAAPIPTEPGAVPEVEVTTTVDSAPVEPDVTEEPEPSTSTLDPITPRPDVETTLSACEQWGNCTFIETTTTAAEDTSTQTSTTAAPAPTTAPDCSTLGQCEPSPESLLETTTPEPLPEITTPIDETTKSPTTLPGPTAPCNSTAPTISPTNTAEIIISVFRYICQLLSLSPSSITVSVANGTQIVL